MVLVDDSIVRGTTSARTIQPAARGRRHRGALCASAPRRSPTPAISAPTSPDEKDLIATGHTRGGDQQAGGFRHAGLPEHRACAAAGHPQQLRVLHRLLYRQVPRGPAPTDTAQSPSSEREQLDRAERTRRTEEIYEAVTGKLFCQLRRRRRGHHRRLPRRRTDETARRPHHDSRACIGGHGRLRRPV